MRGKPLTIQGRASSAGKRVLCAALMHIIRQDGLLACLLRQVRWRCAPTRSCCEGGMTG